MDSLNKGALAPLIPVFLSYVLSFIYVGIYWSNHHLLQAVRHIDGRTLWANLHLLFWLLLIPFVTGWVGENHFGAWPVAFYGVVLLFDAVAYFILARVLISCHGRDSAIAKALGKDFKGKVSVAFYAAAISLSFVSPWLACALYVLVAVMWLIPDRRGRAHARRTDTLISGTPTAACTRPRLSPLTPRPSR